MLVETKLYDLKRSVGLPMIDRLMGVRDREHANRAILVTNTRFSKPAWKQWDQQVRRDLTLVDRKELFAQQIPRWDWNSVLQYCNIKGTVPYAILV